MNAQAASQFESEIARALSHLDLDRAESLAAHYKVAAGPQDLNGDLAHAPWFRATYLSAQVALTAGRLGQTQDLLAPLLPRTSEMPAPLACRVWLMAAEALARTRQFDQGREALAKAEVANQSLPLEPLFKLRQLRIRLWLGEVKGLAEELSTCARFLAQAGDSANLALLSCEEGRAWDALGDLGRAELCWQKAERIPAAPGANPIRADVLVQLGRLEHLRGQLQPALDRYDGALTYAAPHTPQAQEIQLRRWLVLLDLNQWDHVRGAFAALLNGSRLNQLPEEIRGLATMVGALLGDQPSPLEREEIADAEVHGYRLALGGDVEAARALYRLALADTPAPARQARMALALGMLALTAAERVEAKRWLHQAEDLARALDLPEVLWRALQARGQVAAELEGNAETARPLFEEAVLVSEGQARRLRFRTDAAAYHLHRANVMRLLLRAACRRGEPEAMFRCQELERGRLLLELWRAAPGRLGGLALQDRGEGEGKLTELDRQVEACERDLESSTGDAEPILRRREELLVRRDRLLDDFLRDRSRGGDAALPALPALADLEQALPANTVYVAPSLLDDELYLLVARRGRKSQVIHARGSAAALPEHLEKLRRCLASQLERYRQGFPLGKHERMELDGHLEDLGRGPLGAALNQVLDPGRARLVWAPDGDLHGLPIHALRCRGRYLVEQHEVVHTFGGALFVHQHRAKRRPWWRSIVKRNVFRSLVNGMISVLGLGGRVLVVTEAANVLPTAAREGAGVAAALGRSRILHGADASKAAIRRWLPRAQAVHFACHAYFDVHHPLAACIGLPSGETWRALEWLDEPVDGLPLVTLSACRSAAVAPLVGREVFGLVTGLLGSGVRAVLAGLWPVADRETLALMWRFYPNRLSCDLAEALAQAQREALAAPGSSPLFWAAFALFGDAAALPGPRWWWRWWARWRQRRHARRFPLPENSALVGASP